MHLVTHVLYAFLQANLHVRFDVFHGAQDRNEKFGKGFQGKRKQARKSDRGIVKF